MKEPLFRSTKTAQAVITVVMFGLLGISMAAAYAITLRPPRPHQPRVTLPHSPHSPGPIAPESDDEDVNGD